eukprot:TRINITY_DN9538_c0_g1_i2.p1 TRINITY_DN9538_c0_g1~~TRINITY_DN9538_c0_g1_i2.p1  ORF type:complete len:190 (+),score=33.00 TRINITY_DN9538_c0_g1_i2:24-593(+)
MNKYKIAVLGAGAVGKSCICLQFVKNQFVSEYDPTIEDSYRKQIDVDGQVFVLDIFDTAGQEEYATITELYVKTAQGFVVIYAIDNMLSFNHTASIYKVISRAKEEGHLPIVLVGNKCDLEEERVISKAQGKERANEWGDIGFFEASAKERINVDELFEECVRRIISASDSIYLDQPVQPKKRKLCTIL